MAGVLSCSAPSGLSPKNPDDSGQGLAWPPNRSRAEIAAADFGGIYYQPLSPALRNSRNYATGY
jgi:hypothetical protein